MHVHPQNICIAASIYIFTLLGSVFDEFVFIKVVLFLFSSVSIPFGAWALQYTPFIVVACLLHCVCLM